MTIQHFNNRVGLMMDHSPNLLIGLMGILKSGSGFLPIDPLSPVERICFMLEDCEVRLLVTESKHMDKARQVRASCRSLDEIICLDQCEQGDGCEDAVGATTEDEDQLAYVIYTSGSTGQPKGVEISQRNLLPLLEWAEGYFNLGEHTKVLQNLSYFFDFGVFEILTTLLAGGTLHFFGRDGITDAQSYALRIREHGINTVHSTPSFFTALLAGADRLETLEVAHLGGEQLSSATADEIFNTVGERCVLYNGYGPTEASVNSSIFCLGRRDDRKDNGAGSVPIGKATADNSLYILDSSMNLVPVGVPGELHVGGGGVAKGYVNRPDLTAEKFVPDPFSKTEGARLYKTGDIVRLLRDGNIEFLRRADHQVKVRGYRIEPGEIETALLSHEAVSECVVIAHKAKTGDARLVAYLICEGETRPGADELRAHLKGRLPDYMVPNAFVMLEAFPLTPNGKLDRKALPDPGQERPALSDEHVSPRTPIEEAIGAIWRDVLGIDRVGAFDNFFDLGGHSLLATQVVSRLRKAFRVELPLRSFFEVKTVADLAATLVLNEPKAGQTEKIARIFNKINGMSEESLRQAVEQKRSGRG